MILYHVFNLLVLITYFLLFLTLKKSFEGVVLVFLYYCTTYSSCLVSMIDIIEEEEADVIKKALFRIDTPPQLTKETSIVAMDFDPM